MSKSYNEIMEKISVTEEMRERILDNIQANNIAEYRKRRFTGRVRKASFLAGAAVIAILSGTLLLQNFQDRTNTEEPPLEQGMMQAYNGIEECASLEELEEKVGFEIENIEDQLSFVPSQEIYLSYWQELAEVQYTGENQTVTFRKSSGEEDNSGDYNEYAVEKQADINGTNVMLKGTESGIHLAIWNKDGFSYSLSFENAVTQETVLAIIESIPAQSRC